MTNKELELRVIKLEAALLQKELQGEINKRDRCGAKMYLEKEQPKEEFEVGVWYVGIRNVTKERPMLLYCSNNNGYGFYDGVWGNNLHTSPKYFSTYKGYNLRKATPQEIETALIKEAKKRGFKEGVRIQSLKFESNKPKLMSCNSRFEEQFELFMGGSCLFSKGKWATIIENSFEIAGHKVEIDGDDIKIGCQTFNKSDLKALVTSSENCGIEYVYHEKASSIPIYLEELIELLDYINK